MWTLLVIETVTDLFEKEIGKQNLQTGRNEEERESKQMSAVLGRLLTCQPEGLCHPPQLLVVLHAFGGGKIRRSGLFCITVLRKVAYC